MPPPFFDVVDTVLWKCSPPRLSNSWHWQCPRHKASFLLLTERQSQLETSTLWNTRVHYLIFVWTLIPQQPRPTKWFPQYPMAAVNQGTNASSLRRIFPLWCGSVVKTKTETQQPLCPDRNANRALIKLSHYLLNSHCSNPFDGVKHCNPHITTKNLLLSPFHVWGEQGTRQLGNLFKCTQLIRQH